MNIVVVGAGLAGAKAVEELREQGYEGDVTLVLLQAQPVRLAARHVAISIGRVLMFVHGPRYSSLSNGTSNSSQAPDAQAAGDTARTIPWTGSSVDT